MPMPPKYMQEVAAALHNSPNAAVAFCHLVNYHDALKAAAERVCEVGMWGLDLSIHQHAKAFHELQDTLAEDQDAET